jgi:hypothetical protein
MSSHVRKLVRLVPIGLAIVLVLTGSRTASAQISCFEDLAACYQRAASRDGWVDRSLAGADCELGFIDCARRAIIGR